MKSFAFLIITEAVPDKTIIRERGRIVAKAKPLFDYLAI
jgi:hypothetical protein